MEEKKLTFFDKIKRYMERIPIAYIRIYIKAFKDLERVGKKLLKALPKKEKPLLLGERTRRKNR